MRTSEGHTVFQWCFQKSKTPHVFKNEYSKQLKYCIYFGKLASFPIGFYTWYLIKSYSAFVEHAGNYKRYHWRI